MTCPSIDTLQLLGKKEATLKLVSFQQPPTCRNAKSVEGPGDEHELSYILNLDFVINKFCLLSPVSATTYSSIAESGQGVSWPCHCASRSGQPVALPAHPVALLCIECHPEIGV